MALRFVEMLRIRKFFFAISSVMKVTYAGFEKLLGLVLIHRCLPILVAYMVAIPVILIVKHVTFFVKLRIMHLGECIQTAKIYVNSTVFFL